MKIDEPIYGALVVYKHTQKDLGLGHVAFVYAKIKGDDYAVLGGNQGDGITLNEHKAVYLNALFYQLIGFYVPATYYEYAKKELESGGGFGPPEKLADLKKFIGDKTKDEMKTT